MRGNQWYNHFPNNRELTTKSGLCKNLWTFCMLDYELQIQNFFPRCYDLSDQKNVDAFVWDFQTTAIMSIVKCYAEHFMRTTPEIKDFFEEYLRKDQFAQNRVFKAKFKVKCGR
jgi:tubulin monoglycylase TTLL3/8